MWTWLDSVRDTLYGGIDSSIPGIGGPECAGYIPLWLKISEEIFVIVYATVLYVWSFKTLTRVTDDDVRVMRERRRRVGGSWKNLVLLLLALVFGMELSYKIVTGRLLFVMNPCHVITIAQLYLLCVLPSKLSVAVFRIMMHNLFGAFLGVLFSVTNSRQLPGQIPVYWTQHSLICFIPVYIMYLWGPRSLESLSDWSWARASLLFFGHYHHHVLLPLSELTYVNLNNMMCPPLSFQLGGQYYRAIQIVIMSIFVLTFGKLYSALSLWLIGPLDAECKED